MLGYHAQRVPAHRLSRDAADERQHVEVPMTATNRRAMTPQDISRIRFVSDPQISPDGRRVTFVVTTLSEEKDQYLSNIWVVDTAGGGPPRFTTGTRRDTTPRWLADGSRPAFISEPEA